jgi:hypothetical protein
MKFNLFNKDNKLSINLKNWGRRFSEEQKACIIKTFLNFNSFADKYDKPNVETFLRRVNLLEYDLESRDLNTKPFDDNLYIIKTINSLDIESKSWLLVSVNSYLTENPFNNKIKEEVKLFYTLLGFTDEQYVETVKNTTFYRGY